MAHIIRDKQKLLNRVSRIRGQVESIGRALEQEQDCGEILNIIAACRGAIDGLMGEVIEGHIRLHLADPDYRPTSKEAKGAQELIDAIKTYLK